MFRRSAIKKRKRIGEIGEPYGIPISILNSSDSPLSTLIVIVLSRRKLVTQRIIISGIFLFRRLSSSRVYKTLSNTPEISIQSILTIRCFSGRFQMVQTCFVRSQNIISINLLFRAPIQISGRRSLFSASSESLRVIISSRIFLIKFRNAIGLYTLIKI